MRDILVATSGRTVRGYLGTLPGGRKLPGGPQPQEIVIGFAVIMTATTLIAALMPYKTLTVFGFGAGAEVLALSLLSWIKWDGISIINKAVRLVSLLVDRKPIVVAAEELDRQVAANPQAFLVDNGDNRDTDADR